MDHYNLYLYHPGFGSLDLPPIHAGAAFSLGVELAGMWNINDLFVDTDLIRRALDASGYVRPGVQVYQQAGIINPFIVVSGESGREYSKASHLRDAVLSVMQGLNTLNLDTLQFQADTYDPNTGTVSTVVNNNSGGGSGGGSDGKGGVDDFAKKLGELFKVSPSTGLLIGALGALALVLILKR